MNAAPNVIAAPPKISGDDLAKIPVGNEPLPERYATGKDAAVLFAYGHVPEKLRKAFESGSEPFARQATLVIGADSRHGRYGVPFSPVETRMLVFEHLGVKLTLNTISTGTMAKFGRVSGNWMSFVAVSNKKLIDRAIRLISELGKVDYHTACIELFRSIEEISKMSDSAEKPSTVQYTLNRILKQS